MGISGNILIVDDEATLRQTLTRILQRANIKATAVGSGQEGIDHPFTANLRSGLSGLSNAGHEWNGSVENHPCALP